MYTSYIFCCCSYAENECKSYKIFDDASRSQFHVTNYGRPIRCDNGQLDENRWYRFTGRAGNAMADQCVPSSRCQTFGTGWYSGSYPQVILSLNLDYLFVSYWPMIFRDHLYNEGVACLLKVKCQHMGNGQVAVVTISSTTTH